MYNRCSSTIKGGIKLLWESVLSKGSKILDLGGILKNIFTYLLSTLPYIYSISLKYSLISWLKCNCIRPLSQARNYTRNFDALDVDLGNRWITAASTKETKEFPRDELISTYSYRHGCPRYSLVTHGWHYRFLFLFFSLSLSLSPFQFFLDNGLLCPPVSLSRAHHRSSTRLARARISTISTVQCTH